jgi:hypothetical protein
VGVPLIVIVLDAQLAVTPAGKPVGNPIPMAPVVDIVIDVIGVPMQSVGLDEAAETVLFGVPVMLNATRLLHNVASVTFKI